MNTRLPAIQSIGKTLRNFTTEPYPLFERKPKASDRYATQKHYRHMIDVHLIPAFGRTQPRELMREELQKFLSCKLSSGLSWETVHHFKCVGAHGFEPGLLRDRQTFYLVLVSLCGNCARTVSFPFIGVSFERKADAPICWKH